jgi:S1-C subfamily serine protease
LIGEISLFAFEGGPLVTSDGQIIGVNTFKKLTYKFERLGYAILIDQVFNEFGEHISR